MTVASYATGAVTLVVSFWQGTMAMITSLASTSIEASMFLLGSGAILLVGGYNIIKSHGRAISR